MLGFLNSYLEHCHISCRPYRCLVLFCWSWFMVRKRLPLPLREILYYSQLSRTKSSYRSSKRYDRLPYNPMALDLNFEQWCSWFCCNVLCFIILLLFWRRPSCRRGSSYGWIQAYHVQTFGISFIWIIHRSFYESHDLNCRKLRWRGRRWLCCSPPMLYYLPLVLHWRCSRNDW